MAWGLFPLFFAAHGLGVESIAVLVATYPPVWSLQIATGALSDRCTLLAAIGDVVHPAWRASAVGVYRLWHDLGYAVGVLLSGAVADLFGLTWAIVVVAILTLISGVIAALRMTETKRAN